MVADITQEFLKFYYSNFLSKIFYNLLFCYNDNKIWIKNKNERTSSNLHNSMRFAYLQPHKYQIIYKIFYM